MKDIRFEIEKLLAYALDRELIAPADCFCARNSLLDLLKEEEPWDDIAPKGLPCEAAFAAAREACPEACTTPEPILSCILDCAAEAGILEENLTTYRDLLDARIMGLLTPRPSEFERVFAEKEERSAEEATDYFYRLSNANHYIMSERIAKNLYWQTATPYGKMEITVNLSKPEKDPKEVAKLLTVKSAAYPKCLLCPENVGYAGRLNHPARQNLRQLPVRMQGADWYMQYSPYVYYNEHCIVLDSKHTNMCISKKTWRRLFDFVDRFPHYFLGSNADLPLVGGSILFHEHCQGGRHVFPMELAESLEEYRLAKCPGVTVRRLAWPLTAYRLTAADREELCAAADIIFAAWKDFSLPSLGIVAYTEENGQRVRHNTVTPIARKNSAGLYELDMVLRCNITTPSRPDGLFHAAPEYHHIKKENIGLIEVMGLAVLPGRLQKEMGLMVEILSGARTLADMTEAERAGLEKHADWLNGIIARTGTALTPDEAASVLREEVGAVFAKVLECCGVFGQDEEGRKASELFMAACNEVERA